MGNPARLSDERGTTSDSEPPVNHDIAHVDEQNDQSDDSDDACDQSDDVSDPFRNQMDEPAQEVGNAGNVDQRHSDEAANDGPVHASDNLADETADEGAHDREANEANSAPAGGGTSRGGDADPEGARAYEHQQDGEAGEDAVTVHSFPRFLPNIIGI